MASYPVPIRSKPLRLAAELMVPDISEASPNSELVFVVQIDGSNIVARDFSAFLELVDHVYGRSTRVDFDSYSRRNYGHFKFDESRPGSWELVVRQALGLASDATPIVVLWLVLKYLPSALSSISSSYNQIEQGRLARANRQKIRQAMSQDDSLSKLPRERRAELARIIEGVTSKESKLLPRVKRFMKSNFLGVQAFLRDRSNDEE